MLVYLRDGFAQIIAHAVTLTYKLQVKRSLSPSHSTLTPGLPVPVLTLNRQASGRVATKVSIFKSLVWLAGMPMDFCENNWKSTCACHPTENEHKKRQKVQKEKDEIGENRENGKRVGGEQVGPKITEKNKNRHPWRKRESNPQSAPLRQMP